MTNRLTRRGSGSSLGSEYVEHIKESKKDNRGRERRELVSEQERQRVGSEGGRWRLKT